MGHDDFGLFCSNRSRTPGSRWVNHDLFCTGCSRVFYARAKAQVKLTHAAEQPSQAHEQIQNRIKVLQRVQST